MILLRNKLFVGLGDGFGGKKGKIKRNPKIRRTDSYKNWGPWIVKLSDNADEEFLELEKKDKEKVLKILKELETKPYQGNYGQHPLWEYDDTVDYDCVVWSAIINDEDRLNYLIFKTQNQIQVTNLIGHTVIDMKYAIRPKI